MKADARKIYEDRAKERMEAVFSFLNAVERAVRDGAWTDARQSAQSLVASATQMLENLVVLEFVRYVRNGHYRSIREVGRR